MPTLFLLFLLLTILMVVTLYHRFKRIRYRIHGDLVHYRVHSDKIAFLWNLTWYENDIRRTEQNIFAETASQIVNAQHRIILDIFLLNEIVPPEENFQSTTDLLVQALQEKKHEKPEMEGMIITDPVNTFYGMDYCRPIDQLKKSGYEVVITDINKLRDNNLVYSGLWRLLFGWQKSGYLKIIPHPLRPARYTSIRALLKAMNARGNHRKVLICDDKTLITSSNFDNKSSYFCDVGIRIIDRSVADFFAFTEYETARLSGLKSKASSEFPIDNGEGDAVITPLLGTNIRKALLYDIDSTGAGDHIFIGMLFLANRPIINHLKRARRRGVVIEIVLDRNSLSFGKEKIGLPNRIFAPELIKCGIEIRWYLNRREEFHSKIVYIRKGDRGILHVGSANLTRRSLLGTNLESNIRAEARRDAEFLQQTEAYIHRIWDKPYSLANGQKFPKPFVFWYWYTRLLERSGGATF